MIEKSESNQLFLATAPILGLTPSRRLERVQSGIPAFGRLPTIADGGGIDLTLPFVDCRQTTQSWIE